MNSLMGLDMLLLSTTGRRTGDAKDTPLLYIEETGQYYCVASFGGSDRHPQWFLNLVANPRVTLLIKRRYFSAVAYVMSGQERSRIWQKLVEYYPAFARYQKRTERIIPVIRFVPLKDARGN